jgi:hypothetical protein
MAAGLSDRLLSVSNHAGLIDAALPKLGKAGRTKSGSQRKFFGDSDMPKKASKLVILANRIADARRIIDAQQALLEKFRISGEPTQEAGGTLRTYVSSLLHLTAREEKMKADAKS